MQTEFQSNCFINRVLNSDQNKYIINHHFGKKKKKKKNSQLNSNW